MFPFVEIYSLCILKTENMDSYSCSKNRFLFFRALLKAFFRFVLPTPKVHLYRFSHRLTIAKLG